jgi:alanyl-tRNA synthetase
MFEMLGNWSLGDYFKEDAIAWSWEFLTEVCNLDKDRLYVTVFEGAKEDDLTKDEDTFNIWKKYIQKDKILDGNKKDNFWEMGEVGPCGPCSEIHYDNRAEAEREKIDGATLVNKEQPQVIEIWNLVFMQYNRKADKSLEKLPSQHVDTGMGFERLCMIMQGVKSNYDTDIFQPIIQTIEKYSEIEYGKNEKEDIAMRVIADHILSQNTFLLFELLAEKYPYHNWTLLLALSYKGVQNPCRYPHAGLEVSLNFYPLFGCTA